MIDEKTLPPPDRAGGAASPPPAYPEPSFSRAQQLSPTVSSPTSLSASSSSPYPTQTSRNFSQPQQEVVLQPPPMGIPEPVTPPINDSNVPQYPPGYPGPQPPQQHKVDTPPYVPSNQFSPQPMQQMQLDAQIGAQYQQQLYARCARGDHDIEMKHGVCGIIAAVLLFPIGLICLFMDVDKKCSRCGTIVA